MSDGPPPSSLLLYQTEDGRTRLECRFAEDTLWLTQVQMGAAAPAQHRRPRADRGGAFPAERGAPAGRPREGHGGDGQPARGGPLDAGDGGLYGREREGIDLSALRLTHHKLRDLGQQKLNLAGGEPAEGLKPVTEVGSGEIQDRQKQLLAQIIQALNDLFEGELTDGDRVAFAESVRTKLMESETLRAQAAANTREQFVNSPNLREELLNAIISTMEAHGSMSRQALNSEAIQAGLLSVLLGPGALWERLRRGEEGGEAAR